VLALVAFWLLIIGFGVVLDYELVVKNGMIKH
jgi:hypothetical protein